VSDPDLLRAIPWLAEVDEEALGALARTARDEALPAGTVLYRQGEEATDLAVVVRGRLRATSVGEGPARVDREIGRGEPVGEIGLLTGAPRGATVIAVRDSVILRVDRAGVDAALSASPSLGRSLVRVVAERLREPTRPRTSVGSIGVLATGERPLDGSIDGLAAAIRRAGAAVAVPGRDGVADPEHPEALQRLVDAAEQSGEVVILPLDGRRRGWDHAGARQVDLLLLVGHAQDRPEASRATQELVEGLEADGLTPRRELALHHPSSTAMPRGTRAWATATRAFPVHHLRDGHGPDADRLARHLLGTSVGLVLSGGGARAMAHLGAYRALTEAGVVIDRVGGSSIGGVVSLQIAAEVPPDELIELDRKEFQAAAFGRRLTLPVISLLSIQRALRLFDRLFDDRDISDSWIPAFVTTVDLTECVLEVREHGSAARWARATASPPGLWPPVIDERGHLVVDGGVLDNLPVLPMRARGADRVIAVNVSARRDLAVADADAAITSWTDYARRAAASRRAPTFPSVATMVLRLGVVTSLAAQTAAADEIDLNIEPDVAQFTMGNYRRFDAIVDAGYRAAVAALEAGEVPTPAH